MTYIHLKNKSFLPGLILALFFVGMTSGLTQAAQADNRGDRNRQFNDSRRPVDTRGDSNRQFNDSRYHLDRSYPARGQFVRTLPRDRRMVVHGGSRFYFSGGVWYRPYGPRFVIAIPPMGLFIPFLPPYYATIWVGGVPYYYANEVYYANQGSGYVVVEPPQEDVSQTPPAVEHMFIYPRIGQSKQQQADDRSACHRWAVDQTGFDPTQPPGGAPENLKVEKRADYQRAIGSCLDGRGYTVK